MIHERKASADAIMMGALTIIEDAMRPETIGGNVCASALILEEIPMSSPWMRASPDLLMSPPKFAWVSPFAMAKNGTMKRSCHQTEGMSRIIVKQLKVMSEIFNMDCSLYFFARTLVMNPCVMIIQIPI